MSIDWGRPAPGSLSATELAKLGLCETQLVLDRAHGEGRVSSKARAARRHGVLVHERALEAAVAAGRPRDTRCFIATAVYGSDAQETEVLRRWRDARLARSRLGRLAIKLYYRLSPSAAAILRRCPPLLQLARRALDAMVRRIGP